jgi:replicative DNA helicase
VFEAQALPISQDVERLVLGCLMITPELMHEARGALNADDFGTERHKRIWAAMCAVYDGGAQVDRITIANRLMQVKQLDSCGGLGYVVGLDDGVPQLPDLGSYTKILQDQASRRRVILTCDSLMKRAASGEEVQPLLDSLVGLSLEAAPQVSGGLVTAQELVERLGVQGILTPRIERGVNFPWNWMNYHTCGMLPGELWVLAGHTSTGKSSAALQTAVHVARNQKKTAAIFSLEMADVALLQRAVWQSSRVDSEQAKRGKLDTNERRRATEALSAMADTLVCFDDRSASVSAMHAQLRKQRARGPIGLVVVDYLQLLRDGGRHATRAEAVGANARALKLLATELECPVLLLSQFSRESAKSKPGESPRRPELYDLKESGDIENHARCLVYSPAI